MKKIIALLMATFVLFALVGCAPKTASNDNTSPTTAPTTATAVDKIKAAGKLVIATNAAFEPFEYQEKQVIKGFDIDVAQKIADKLGVELEILNISFKLVVPSIASGKADLGLAALSITEDRKKSVDFSNPYFNTTQKILVKSDSTIASKDDLTDKKIGVQTGTTGYTIVKKDLKTQPVDFDNGAIAVQSLLTGKVDAVVIDEFPANKFLEANPTQLKILPDEFVGEQYAIAFKKGSPELVEFVNQVISDMDKSGELEALLVKYKLNK